MFGIFKDTKNTANICLGIAFLIYMLAEIAKTAYKVPSLGYVIAFAEAAMVGGIADWFAVTALFRHPLGLKIPHTALIPKNKDKIGQNLSNFLRENFLSPEYVKENIQKYPISQKAGQLLELHKDKVLEQTIIVLKMIVSSFKYEQIQVFLINTIISRFKELDLREIVLKLFEDVKKKNQHQELVDFVLNNVQEWLAVKENAEKINEWIRKAIRTDQHGQTTFTGRIKSWFMGDPELHRQITDLINHLNSPEGADLRQDIDNIFNRFVEGLKKDSKFAEKLESMKISLIESANVENVVSNLLKEMHSWLENDLNDKDSKIKNKIDEWIVIGVDKLKHNEKVIVWIKQNALKYLPKLIIENGEKIDAYLVNYIKKLDGNEITHLIEEKVGDDLQYIRINGTIVGGLIGLLIYSLSQGIEHFFSSVHFFN